MIISIILLLITLAYNGYIFFKYKVIPESLSETSYLLGRDRDSKKYWFTLYCIVTSLLLLITLLPITNLTFLVFLTCFGLMLAGVSPTFKSGLDKPVHYIASMISFISFILFMIFEIGWIWLTMYAVLLSGLIFFKKECFVYFAEMLAILFIIFFL